jgi:transposase
MSERSYGPLADQTTVFMEKAVMAQFDVEKNVLIGPQGQLEIPQDDEIILKFLMLQEGECDGPGPLQAAAKFGFSKQRYYQLRTAFAKQGTQALKSRKRGPQTRYRRTAELERQVIRHRFLDRDASPQVIAQKLVQGGWKISIRSVERVLEEYGLQKKTPQIPATRRRRSRRGTDQP